METIPEFGWVLQLAVQDGTHEQSGTCRKCKGLSGRLQISHPLCEVPFASGPSGITLALFRRPRMLRRLSERLAIFLRSVSQTPAGRSGGGAGGLATLGRS